MPPRPKLLTPLRLAISILACSPVSRGVELPLAGGPFKPEMESLKQYQCPEWFRDAKFGIWAHWGPQAVPMEGDWYARRMYEQGGAGYQYQVAHYGHPSVSGYKDIIPLWKAEKWDPERLMALYKKAGARYFVSMGTHHDNFFLWNSKIHSWNSVNMGPKRDVVGEWQQAARHNGLRFGVSEHLGASFTWFQGSHGADKSGPKAGVAYDGADPQYQELYHFPAEPGDTGWYSNNPKFHQQWYNEIKELVDLYHPDLLYSDGPVAFNNEVGLSMIAHLYNSNAASHGGKTEAIYNCKQQSGGRWVEDLERGIMAGIAPDPWQTDTSIGDWFYNRHWKFRPVSWVIHMLVDNVSKNGNLLLNVVQRPDGAIDPEVEHMLEQLASWIAIHGEAIYGTRPWTVYGESKVRVKGGSFSEDFKYDSNEIRFTTKGPVLYAVALGWPGDRRLTIRSLAKPAGQNVNLIKDVRLLGYEGELSWKQDGEALVVTLPEQPVSEWTAALKITGSHLTNIAFDLSVPVTPDATGKLSLKPGDAECSGALHVETRGGEDNLGFWDQGKDSAAWKVNFTKPGRFRVTTAAATQHASELVVEVAGQQLGAKTPASGSWDKFQQVDLGQLTIEAAGIQVVKVRAKDPAHWNPVNLRALTLTPIP